MSESTTRYGFALLCALGMLAIALGAFLEIARFRRHAARNESSHGATHFNGSTGARDATGARDEASVLDEGAPAMGVVGGSLLSLRQFRLRLFSAALWMLVLGALYYAVTVQWPTHHGPNPTPAQIEQARGFAMTLICAFAGMFVGFGLLAWDMIQLARERQAQTARFHQGLADLARRESQRIQTLKNVPPPSPIPNQNAKETDSFSNPSSGAP